MDFRRRLSGLFASELIRFAGATLGLLFLLATLAAVFTGDWNIPLFLAVIIVFIFLRIIILAVIFFWRIWIAIIIVWRGYKIPFKKKSKEESNGDPSNTEQPDTI
jgi:predicted membrane protein